MAETYTIADIIDRHPEDMAWMREHASESSGRWGPQHVDEDTRFLVEEIRQSVGTFYVYRSLDGEVTVQVGGQAEPIISIQ